MPTHRREIIYQSDSTASFRAWGSQVDQGFEAAGAIRASDAGQINWNTVNVPAGPNQFTNGTIYQFTDALQTTHPVFIQLVYGIGGLSSPSLLLRVGTNTNGNSVLSNSQQIAQLDTRGNSTSPGRSFFCCGPSWFAASLQMNRVTNPTNPHAMCLSVERTKNGSGEDTSEGIIAVVMAMDGGGSAAHRWAQFYSYSANAWRPRDTIGVMWPNNGELLGNSDGQLSTPHPFHAFDRARVLNPITSFIGVDIRMHRQEVPFTVYHYLQNIRYIVTPQLEFNTSVSHVGQFRVGGNNLTYAMRWE